MTITARVILDSVNPYGSRLTTCVCTYPRYLHSQVMTHRMFSRNTSSSRAIPTEKMIAAVQKDMVVPIHFGRLQPGMQAEEELEGEERDRAESRWREIGAYVVEGARDFFKLGLHKQIANRILEPFAHVTATISFTESANFLHLRDNGKAQHGIQILGRELRAVLKRSRPQKLDWGDWHTPFILPDEVGLDLNDKIRVSAARAARTSYLTHEGIRSIQKDLQLYSDLVDRKDWLKDPVHASALEHPAQARNPDEISGVTWLEAFEGSMMSNFHPTWLQLRKTVVGENKVTPLYSEDSSGR